MKKTSAGMRVLTLGAALSLFAVSLFTEDMIKASVPYRDAVRPEYISYAPYVTAKGQITKSGEKSVMHRAPAYISEVCVAVGDIVSKGDTICTVSGVKAASVSGASDRTDYYGSVTELPEEDIVADCSGVITSLDVNPDSVFSGGIVARVNSDETYLVTAVVSERNISDVNIGDTATVTGSAFAQKTFNAEIVEISDNARKLSEASFETVVDVSLLISDAPEKLLGGVSATAKIYTGEERNILIVPYECICQDDEGNEFVYICEENRAVKTDVITGAECDDGIEIIDGVKETDLVVMSAEDIDNGSFIRYEVVN